MQNINQNNSNFWEIANKLNQRINDFLDKKESDFGMIN